MYLAYQMSSLIIRSCGPDEVSRVLDLWQVVRSRLGATDDTASLRALATRDEDALLIAELDGRLVGTLIAAWDGWRGNMYRLVVHPDHRGEAVSTRLIHAGEAVLRDRGARRVTALVWREDRRAARTWARAGYELEEGTGRFVRTL